MRGDRNCPPPPSAPGKILADRGLPEKAPRRREAVVAVRALARAIEARSAEGVRRAEADVEQLRHLLTDQEAGVVRVAVARAARVVLVLDLVVHVTCASPSFPGQ